MTTPRVLQIGIDPAVVDFSPYPGQDADRLRARIGEAAESLRRQGFEVTVCLLTDDPEAVEETVASCLASRRFEVVEIGSGLRTSHTYTAVFERAVNTVSARQPGAVFAFNDSPEDTLAAVRRALDRLP